MTTAVTNAINSSLLDLEAKKVLIAALAGSTIDVSGLTATVQALHDAVLVDLTSLKNQFNQLRTDYNANANIVTDTTATAVTLTLS